MSKTQIKTADWMPVSDVLFVTNGVDAVAKLDGTNKEAQYPIKEAKYALYHKGRIFTDKDVENISPEIES